jgi:hydroxysqualene dehydroxylase
MAGTVHVIGAGLAGLSAAIRLADERRAVVVHEATGAAGGRCRSYHDPALDLVIDNGNHLLLSGNRAALDYLARIGAGDARARPRSHSPISPRASAGPFA